MYKKIHLIRQMGATECGAACLAMILNFYGCKIKVSDIESHFLVGRDGMTILQMKEVAKEFGFELHAYKHNFDENVFKHNTPGILCSLTNHYVVISKKGKKQWIIYDPSQGKREVSFDYLKDNYRDVIVLLKMVKKVDIKENKKNYFHLKINKGLFLSSMIMTLLCQSLIIWIPGLIQRAIDAPTSGKYYSVVNWLGVTLVFFLGYFIINYLKQKILLELEMNVYKDTMYRLVNKLFKIDLNYFASHSSGDIVNRLNNTTVLFQFISSNVISSVIDIITAIICSVVMIRISFGLYLILFTITFFEIFFVLILNKKQRWETQEFYAIQSELNSRLVDVLSHMTAVREMGYQEGVQIKLNQEYKKLVDSTKRKNFYSDKINNIVRSVNLVSNLLLYVIGISFVIEETISMGNLVAFVALTVYFTGPFQTLAIIFPQFNSLKETMNRLKDIMEYREMSAISGNKRVEYINSISVNNISYKYASAEENSLCNISFSINKGEKVAIVGKSGSGKSTLIKIITNTISPTLGNIKINGYNVSYIETECLNQKIAVVTQTPFIIGTTIRDNIDFFNTLTDSDILEALESAKLGDDIKNFPLGIYTQIGEGGQNISGGQKQRIAIARAIAAKPEIIIFDEATSNLDTQTEKDIYDNLKKSEMTQIIITHRLQVVRDADFIVTLESGKMLGSGTHEELMSFDNPYSRQISCYKEEREAL